MASACESLHPGEPCPCGGDWVECDDETCLRAHFEALVETAEPVEIVKTRPRVVRLACVSNHMTIDGGTQATCYCGSEMRPVGTNGCA